MHILCSRCNRKLELYAVENLGFEAKALYAPCECVTTELREVKERVLSLCTKYKEKANDRSHMAR